MRMDEILDNFIDFKNPKPVYSWNYTRWWYYIVCSIIINAFYLALIPPMADFINEFSQNLIGALLITLIGGFILGAIIALFPFKGLNYKAKYLRSSQWAMIIILIIYTLACSVMWLTGSLE